MEAPSRSRGTCHPDVLGLHGVHDLSKAQDVVPVRVREEHPLHGVRGIPSPRGPDRAEGHVFSHVAAGSTPIDQDPAAAREGHCHALTESRPGDEHGQIVPAEGAGGVDSLHA